jgi:hypothetical protein
MLHGSLDGGPITESTIRRKIIWGAPDADAELSLSLRPSDHRTIRPSLSVASQKLTGRYLRATGLGLADSGEAVLPARPGDVRLDVSMFPCRHLSEELVRGPSVDFGPSAPAPSTNAQHTPLEPQTPCPVRESLVRQLHARPPLTGHLSGAISNRGIDGSIIGF